MPKETVNKQQMLNEISQSHDQRIIDAINKVVRVRMTYNDRQDNFVLNYEKTKQESMPCGYAIVAVSGLGTATAHSRPSASTRRRTEREHKVVFRGGGVGTTQRSLGKSNPTSGYRHFGKCGIPRRRITRQPRLQFMATHQ